MKNCYQAFGLGLYFLNIANAYAVFEEEKDYIFSPFTSGSETVCNSPNKTSSDYDKTESPNSDSTLDGSIGSSRGILEGLKLSLSKKYLGDLKGYLSLNGFLSEGAEPEKGLVSELSEADIRAYSTHLFINNFGSDLKNFQTIGLMKHLYSVATETGLESYTPHQIRHFFEKVDHLSIDLKFWRWSGDRLRGLNTNSIYNVISLFPNLKKLSLSLNGLVRDFVFPIPESTSGLKELEVRLLDGISDGHEGNNEPHLSWQASWANPLIKAIESNKSLEKLTLKVPAVSVEHFDRLKSVLINHKNLKNFGILDPRNIFAFSLITLSDCERFDESVRDLFERAPWIKATYYSGFPSKWRTETN